MTTRTHHPRFRAIVLVALALTAAACDDPTDPAPLFIQAATLEAVGDAVQLTAGNAGDALPRWESLDPDVVTVTPAGMAVAKSAGAARVRATLGSRTGESTVTVLPPVEVTVSDLAVVTSGGETGLGMRLRNQGGRGFFRIEYWREKAAGETEHQRILVNLSDYEAPVGLDIQHQTFVGGELADWVMVYSRQPASTAYEMTGCIRLDGGEPCPMP